MLQPKKTKFRRMQKGRMKGLAQRGNQLAYGSFAIKALESTWITGRQIEAARQAITRYMKREGQLWIRIFPDKPITKKPAEVRMGKGKGNPEGFVAPVTPGRILFEAAKSAGARRVVRTYFTDDRIENAHALAMEIARIYVKDGLHLATLTPSAYLTDDSPVPSLPTVETMVGGMATTL